MRDFWGAPKDGWPDFDSEPDPDLVDELKEWFQPEPEDELHDEGDPDDV